jgi:hypothetical protein
LASAGEYGPVPADGALVLERGGEAYRVEVRDAETASRQSH